MEVSLLELIMMHKIMIFFVKIGKIQKYIIESTKKITEKSSKNSLSDNFSKMLPELEFRMHCL